MINALRLLRTAENEIIILRAVIFMAEAAGLFQKFPLHNKQMADIIDAAKQILVKIRFKMRIKQSAAVHIQLILIGIDHITLRMLVDSGSYFKQGMLRQSIVMICQNDKIAGCHFQRRIGIAGNTQIVPQILTAEAAVLFHILLHDPVNDLSLARRTSICHTDLPIPVGLGQNRIQHLTEIFLRSFIGRNDDRQQRLIGKPGLPLGCQLLLRGLCQIVPLGIIIIVVQSLQLMPGF